MKKHQFNEKIREFTNQYSLTKTIRMELVPYNDDAKNLIHNYKSGCENGISKGKKFANNYVIVKKILDDYYRSQINENLSVINLNDDKKIENAFDLFVNNKIDKNNKQFENSLKNLRIIIASALKPIKEIKYEKLINLYEENGEKTCELIKFIKQNEKLSEQDKEEYINSVSLFNSFVGYFSGYKENRNNMFSEKAEITAISNRLINENMILYLENCLKLEKIKNNAEDLYHELGDILKEFMLPIHYSMLLTQDKIKKYNKLIGHDAGDKFVKGCNQLINEYRLKYPEKKKNIPFLNQLYNQILFRDIETQNVIEKISTDKELFEIINIYIENTLDDYLRTADNLFYDKTLFSDIYFLPNKFSSLSTILFESENRAYSILKRKLAENNFDISKPVNINDIENNFKIDVYKILKCKYDQIILEIKKNIETIKPILLLEKLDDDKSVPKIDDVNDKGGIGFQQIAIIQNLFNSIIELNRFMQLFALELNGQKVEIENKNLDFYYQYEKICELNKNFTLYLKTKDYLTKKPYSNDKIRLFFDNNSYFLNGFVESKTDTSDHGTQYGGYLFRKRNSFGEYDYFLGCSKNAKLFREHLVSSISEGDKSEFERFYYYQLKTQTIYNNYKNQNGESYEIDKQKLKDAILDATKKCGLPFNYEKEDTPTNYLKKIENENPSLFKLVISNENVIQLQLSIINNLKTVFGKYVSKVPALKDIIDKEYKLLKDFNDDIQIVSSNKIIYYAPVSQKELEELQTQNEDSKKIAKFYLFKIQNKDLKDKSKRTNKTGTDNLHTMYFKALMSENQYTFDIGAGMVFFREQNYTGKKITHDKNKPIKNKTCGYTKKESVFAYEIIKDERYFKDKFFLHLSLSINYTKPSLKISDLNTKVNKFLYKNRNEITIMGIDRGERNLIYLTIIDLKGNIILQKSMNELVYNVKTDRTEFQVHKNYHTMLNNRVKERDLAKKSWGVIDSIKELKEGYLSQVVHEIILLMMRYNSIIVMEDLNPNFKHSRISIDSQIYQKFEKALIDKLGYLVLKRNEIVDGEIIEKGNILNGFQLACPVPAIKDMKNQNGFIFYVWPQYTSKIDPVSGFVSMFDTSEKNIDGYISFFKKFSAIKYNGQDFEFYIDDYQLFFDKKNKMPLNKFVLTSKGTKWINVKTNGKWESIPTEPTKELLKLFENRIDINGDIRAQITENKMSSEFYYNLTLIFKNIVQLRNSKTGDASVDYILSPYLLEDGTTFNSLELKEKVQNGKDVTLPIDADANGAYHIALKGLMALETITEDGKIKISNKNTDWFEFIQKKKYKN